MQNALLKFISIVLPIENALIWLAGNYTVARAATRATVVALCDWRETSTAWHKFAQPIDSTNFHTNTVERHSLCRSWSHARHHSLLLSKKAIFRGEWKLSTTCLFREQFDYPIDVASLCEHKRTSLSMLAIKSHFRVYTPHVIAFTD